MHVTCGRRSSLAVMRPLVAVHQRRLSRHTCCDPRRGRCWHSHLYRRGGRRGFTVPLLAVCGSGDPEQGRGEKPGSRHAPADTLCLVRGESSATHLRSSDLLRPSQQAGTFNIRPNSQKASKRSWPLMANGRSKCTTQKKIKKNLTASIFVWWSFLFLFFLPSAATRIKGMRLF